MARLVALAGSPTGAHAVIYPTRISTEYRSWQISLLAISQAQFPNLTIEASSVPGTPPTQYKMTFLLVAQRDITMMHSQPPPPSGNNDIISGGIAEYINVACTFHPNFFHLSYYSNDPLTTPSYTILFLNYPRVNIKISTLPCLSTPNEPKTNHKYILHFTMPTNSTQDTGATGATKWVTSTLGNTVGGVTRTVGGVAGVASRGVGDTISSATGSAGKPVGDALGSAGSGMSGGAKAVAKGVEDAGQWKRS